MPEPENAGAVTPPEKIPEVGDEFSISDDEEGKTVKIKSVDEIDPQTGLWVVTGEDEEGYTIYWDGSEDCWVTGEG